ncbi:MAG: hypothetical protein H0T76_28755 [Nannocystis sp.]|nr:hypothetical protein [Nannocystis sp.]MBA3550485.1 hypothetical protein [Nannocystis sp.]
MRSSGLTFIRTSPRPSTLASGALLAGLLAACNTESGTTAASATDGSSGGSTGSSSPTTGTTGTTTNSSTPTTGEPTVGSASNTDSGTTTATGTTDATVGNTDSTTGTTDASGTTMPVQTTSGTSTGTTAGETLGETTDSTGMGSSTGDSTTGAVEEPCACPPLEVPLDDGIFVLSDNSELYKFYPETNTFQMLGAFKCGNATGTFSMAVDRLGYAYVMFSSPLGEIWKLDVTNVNDCSDPGYNPGQGGVNYFGMAFVSNSKFDQCDKLYGNTFNGLGGFSEGPNIGDFLSVDPNNLLVNKIGKTNFNGAEVTGTGDGRAFMFGGANPAKLVEVEKATGKFIETTPLGNLELTNAFAFAFFGGDFYLFTESDNNPFNTSKVTHFDYDDSDNNGVKELTTVVTEAPIRIVGAGVSTCAPFAPV